MENASHTPAGGLVFFFCHLWLRWVQWVPLSPTSHRYRYKEYRIGTLPDYTVTVRVQIHK